MLSKVTSFRLNGQHDNRNLFNRELSPKIAALTYGPLGVGVGTEAAYMGRPLMMVLYRNCENDGAALSSKVHGLQTLIHLCLYLHMLISGTKRQLHMTLMFSCKGNMILISGETTEETMANDMDNRTTPNPPSSTESTTYGPFNAICRTPEMYVTADINTHNLGALCKLLADMSRS